ncbi:dihydrolipoamide acetyltransferase family protein [Trujillonella endophytica]|uniref:Dihydrolipoamide acetyltransferase component of pyruvate dehydrogenase complex n=1 Tax=Trujillonella endophytica TaxID=673521 RepID=A0A1H8UDQ3_9ACTN|nr:dihydrolipoamide acetyltransferase family protein [Trujillella endophytica]SEP01157.1 pyruvate dehydrogenase E2 component (dihydrolipoamide acetyltransferase) [Trujillella endophytica]
MGALRQFALPDVGEGLTEGEILQWLVAVGDEVTVNQPLCEVETAKAAVELPSPYAGTVTELLHEAGATVDVGSPIVTIDVGGEAADGGGAADAPERTANLVGYGPRTTEARRRPRRGAGAVAALASAPTAAPAAPVHAAVPAAAPVHAAVPARPAPHRTGRPRPLAKPPVRKLARDLGVDLTLLAGSGPGGVITRADVETAAADTAPALSAAPAAGAAEQRIPVTGVRKHTAAAMVASAFTAPHVTEFLTVDVTRTMKLRGRLAARPEFAGIKVSPLLFVAKALLLAVRRHPMVNARWEEETREIVVPGHVHLGIAAATPRGLLVPNVKEADRLSLPDLARALAELTETARAGRTSPADMAGGTITITNVGVFGVDTGTPILNPGESAILAFGAVRPMPWVHKGKVRPRQVTTLALSFDHRVVDGELGSRFLADVGAVLHDPAAALAY